MKYLLASTLIVLKMYFPAKDVNATGKLHFLAFMSEKIMASIS
jgi:hypothetical protein